jgi:hypothetical protein
MTHLRHAVRPAVFALSLALVAGCSGLGSGLGTTTVGAPPYEQGSGTVASESRSVASFHGVSAAQGVRVELANGTPAITVTADDNVLSHVSTAVTDGILVVDVSGGFQTHQPPKVVIATTTPPDHLSASTGATIDAEGLTGSTLTVGASTGATVRGGGRVDALTLTAVGGATADLRNLEAKGAQVDVSTGSTAHVTARGSVTGSCSSGSTLRVHGDASTDGLAVDESSTMSRE